jgi:hypothetical protein
MTRCFDGGRDALLIKWKTPSKKNSAARPPISRSGKGLTLTGILIDLAILSGQSATKM